MGDTAAWRSVERWALSAVATHNEFVLAIIGGLFVAEALSVDRPGRRSSSGTGPRVFLMAPIHHHFEHKGWSEPTVVIRFWIIAFRAGAGRPFDAEAAVITAEAWRNKHYAVYGLARSGQATVRALLASGARVTAWDEREEARTALAEELRLSRAKSRDMEPGASTSLGTNGIALADLSTADLTQFDSLIVSPGVPLNTHPLAARARAAGLEIIGDIELFARARAELPPHKVVGITGTNGKSTTTALVHHILKTAGVPTTMGGNIGLPILAQDPLPRAASMCWSCRASRST
jgi:hypothetical protein